MMGIVHAGPAADPLRFLYLICSAARRTTMAVKRKVHPLMPSRMVFTTEGDRSPLKDSDAFRSACAMVAAALYVDSHSASRYRIRLVPYG